MLLLKPVLMGVVLPAVVCGVFLVMDWRPWRRLAPIAGGNWGGALGFMLGYLIAHAATVGWPPLLPVDVTQWLPYLAGAAGGVGVLDSLWGDKHRLRLAIRLFVSAGAVWLLLRPILEHTWTPTQGTVWVVLLALALFATWISLDALAKPVRGASVPLAMFIVAVGGSVVLLVSKTASLAQLCGAVAAMTGVSMLVAWRIPAMSLVPGATAVVAMLFGCLWLEGYLYAEVPGVSAVLLAAAPAGLWIGQMPWLRGMGAWRAVLVRGAAVLVPTLIALAVAVAASGYGQQDAY